MIRSAVTSAVRIGTLSFAAYFGIGAGEGGEETHQQVGAHGKRQRKRLVAVGCSCQSHADAKRGGHDAEDGEADSELARMQRQAQRPECNAWSGAQNGEQADQG